VSYFRVTNRFDKCMRVTSYFYRRSGASLYDKLGADNESTSRPEQTHNLGLKVLCDVRTKSNVAQDFFFFTEKTR